MTRAEQLTEKAERLARIQEAGHPDGFLWNACNCIFPTWPEELAWMEAQGFELVRPEHYIEYQTPYHVPRVGPEGYWLDEWKGCSGSMAARFGYPIYRRKENQP